MLLFGFILLSYIICRAILPLRLHWGWKAGLALAAALAAFKFHILHWFGGEMFFAPELPVPVLLGAAWYYAVFFLFFFLLAGADIVRGIVLAWMFCRGRKRTERFRVVGNRVNLALLAGAMMLAAIGIVAGTAVPEVREERIELERLPQELEGFTIAVLADLHADTLTRAGRIRAIVERANACSPDLTVIAGDFVDGRVAERGAELRPLAELRAGYGVFGVPGNHEYYSGYREWMRFLPTLGIRMLENTCETIAGGRLTLAGVTDPAAVRFGLEAPDIRGAFAGTPAETVKVLLAHQPKLAPEAAAEGADLQISGHTHGGLILGFDRLVAHFNAGFVSGFYRVGAMALYVTRGSGMWNGFPVRLGVPSEITLLRLTRGGGG